MSPADLSPPDIAEPVREAVVPCKDVRVTDSAVEPLDELDDADMATFDHRLHLAPHPSEPPAERSLGCGHRAGGQPHILGDLAHPSSGSRDRPRSGHCSAV